MSGTIVNIRGTSGSGKSTLVRAVMDHPAYGTKLSFKEEGRKRPIGYQLVRVDGNGPDLAVIGHYETACGGCDTINKMERIFGLVGLSWEKGMDVLFEGLLISADAARTIQLADYVGLEQLLVVGLNVPLQLCLDSVNARRREKRGPDAPPVNPKNTESKWKGTRSSMKRLEAHGISCEWHDRNSALDRVLRAFQLAPVED